MRDTENSRRPQRTIVTVEEESYHQKTEGRDNDAEEGNNAHQLPGRL